MLRALAIALAISVAAAVPADAQASRTSKKLFVVTTTTDLHDIAHAVGGNRIDAIHISEGYQDPHFVEAKPSFILRLRKADVFAYVGLDLEVGWMSLLVDGARNSKIRPGGSGNLDVSRVIPVLDQARGKVDRSQGDVHPLGNPHYWLDAGNGRRIARLFRDRFSRLDPGGAAVYAENTRQFEARLSAAERAWAPLLARIKGKPVVAWHTSWKYLAQYTGMNIIGFMEPKPGVPPSPAHLTGLIGTIRRTGAKVIVMEPFYDRKMADFVAARSGAKVLILPPSVGGVRAVRDYIGLLRYDIEQLANAL
ncbi:MAG TPA: metal ABC transporter substrate-binding protein [Gemmatimonadaceae bacterium]|nr:metal ABC transporter substrate-binding protein [Gemmatimonadaceae bacterium]